VDLYACGVMLYEALTGRRPFSAANYNALLLLILSTSPRPARDLRPALPGGFDAVIERAMARSRDDRYRSATEFQRDLQALRDRHNGSPVGLGEALRDARNAPDGDDVQVQWRPPFGSRPAPAPTPSSVEIPIVFSDGTPASGEALPFDPGQPEEHPLRDTVPTGKPTVRDTDVTGRPSVSAMEERDARGAPYAQPRAPGFPRKKAVRTRPGSPDDTVADVPEDVDGGEPTQLMPSRAPKAPRR
jgi:serine/threonine protein kinase